MHALIRFVAVLSACALVACDPDDGSPKPVPQPDATADAGSDTLSPTVTEISGEGVVSTDGDAALCQNGAPNPTVPCQVCNAGAWVAAAIGAGCDDGDPCTIGDSCGAATCKGTLKNCDDNQPCTTDVCQIDGACSHKANMHWDCIPDLVVDFPPRGHVVQGGPPQVQVKGHVVTQKANPVKTAQVKVNGAAVQLQGDTFTAPMVLQLGHNLLTVELTDATGGTRALHQGIVYASNWSAPGDAVAAGALGLGAKALADAGTTTVAAWVAALQPALKNTDFSAQTPLSAKPVLVHLALDGVAVAATSAFALTVPLTAAAYPESYLVPLGGLPAAKVGVPLIAGCGQSSTDFGLGAATVPHRWALTVDVMNAALRAAWLGGALEDDITPLVKDAYPPLTFTGKMHGLSPFFLDGCGKDGWVIRVADLRFPIVAELGENLAPVEVVVALQAPVKLQVVDGVLELSIGAPWQAMVDVEMIPEAFWGTDGQVGMQGYALDKVLPKLVAGWQKAPLVRVKLPDSVGFGGKVVGLPVTKADGKVGVVTVQ